LAGKSERKHVHVFDLKHGGLALALAGRHALFSAAASSMYSKQSMAWSLLAAVSIANDRLQAACELLLWIGLAAASL
jgi:hypothetical protein